MTELLLAPGVQRRTTLTIKRSVFHTDITRVDSQEEAREFISLVKAEFPDARHHCSAYVITPPGSFPLAHSSDDGEPSGTAGRPMLDVLQGAGLSNVLAVVTRYFGGILLGTGGLVQAYSDSVRQGLEGVDVVERSFEHLWATSVPHAAAGKIEAEVRRRGARFCEVTYLPEAARLECSGERDALTGLLSTILGQAVDLESVGTRAVEIPAGSYTANDH